MAVTQACRRAAGKKGTQVLSIFGQIEACAAGMMIEKYKLYRIPVEDFPEGAPLYNEKGTMVAFAIVLPAEHVREFEDTIKRLRS